MEDVVDDNWCFGFGASHHMTPALDQFYDAQPSSSMISIIKVLEITHLGKIRLKTPFGMLDLESALCVSLNEKKTNFHTMFK